MSSYPGPGTPEYPQQPYPEYPAPPYPTRPGSYPPPPEYSPAAQPMYPYAPAPMPGYYPGPMAPSNNGYAIASLVCSIGGWTFIPVIGWIVGIILGIVALNQIRASNGTQAGHGLAVAGVVIGIIGLALGLIACVFFAILVASMPGYQLSGARSPLP
jgi:uncharacterized protein with PQ loop repeat